VFVELVTSFLVKGKSMNCEWQEEKH
jgi:hypothetical protein